MAENISYTLNDKELKRIENYLGKHSYEHAFSAEKGEEKYLCFIDNNKKIFAILKQDIKEVELDSNVSQKMIDGIEKFINFGGRR